MAKEIERKFLVTNESWKQNSHRTLFRQGYLSSNKDATIRVRIAGEKGYIAVKGITTHITRDEFEYEIPLPDAISMLDSIVEKNFIEKYRYTFKEKGYTWEVDEFLGNNTGLIIAEIELNSEAEHIELPSWIGEEVTGNIQYYNSSLASHPFTHWKNA